MPETLVSLAEVAVQSNQIATVYSLRRKEGYHTTANQVCFFTLAWIAKKATKQGKWDQLEKERQFALEDTEIADVFRNVGENLNGSSGEVVTKLQTRDETGVKPLEQLLAACQRRIFRKYDCKDLDLQAEIIQRWWRKLLEIILQRMIDGTTIDNSPDTIQLVFTNKERVTSSYNFSSLFAAFVAGVLENEVRNEMRSVHKQQQRTVHLEDLYLLDKTGEVIDEPVEFIDKSVDVEAQILKKETEAAQYDEIKGLLLQLLTRIESLPKKRRLVVAYSLAGRPLFQQIMQRAGLPAPDWIPALSGYAGDKDIAAALSISDNNVRVHRSNARQDINTSDAQLGKFFDHLLDVGADRSG